ncbi:MAG TPA: methyltransferase domain-containing protein [Acidimicrobiales bacterium]|nr:methyltransferase domain-containing protein [Acidimicrobiales bacterium]
MTNTFQDEYYSAVSDYRNGSPHLAHERLNNKLVGVLQSELENLNQRGLPLNVLEVGAGHGAFTEPLLRAGAKVTAAEMAKASADLLTARFGHFPGFNCVHNADGSFSEVGRDYSMVVCVSVLHHIPDYASALEDLSSRVRSGGSLVVLQEPLWYPRARKSALYLNKAGYFAWRLRQGDLTRGIATQTRRLRGKYDPGNPSDMVEYHVVRSGVDEETAGALLAKDFETVEYIKYWSNQSGTAQRLGERWALLNTFGVSARGRT